MKTKNWKPSYTNKERKDRENIKDKKLFEKINAESTKRYLSLVKFLYDNHKPILREWEATQGSLRIEFAGAKGK